MEKVEVIVGAWRRAKAGRRSEASACASTSLSQIGMKQVSLLFCLVLFELEFYYLLVEYELAGRNSDIRSLWENSLSKRLFQCGPGGLGFGMHRAVRTILLIYLCILAHNNFIDSRGLESYLKGGRM